jgi:Reverse transcriptase (RNA-dependent DNA polymerase)
MYADDIAIIATGTKATYYQLHQNLNKALETVSRWCETTGLLVNPEKSQLLKFYPGNRFLMEEKPVNKESIKIYLNNTEIKRCKSAKLLGIIIDDKLDWNEHIKYIKNKGITTLYAAKNLIGKKMGNIT